MLANEKDNETDMGTALTLYERHLNIGRTGKVRLQSESPVEKLIIKSMPMVSDVDGVEASVKTRLVGH